MGISFESAALVALALVVGCGDTVVASIPDDASISPDAPTGPRERCNGVDDDRDRKLDEGCPIRLTRTDGNEFDLFLRDGALHFIAESGPMGDGPGGVFALDLVSGTWTPIPNVLGSYLSFDDEGQLASANFSGCFVLDLATGVSTDALRVVPTTDSFQQRCAVDGDYMVTTASVGVWGYYDVYYYRLSDGAVASIPLPGDQQYAAIDDGLIVWNDRQDFAVWAFRIGGGKPPYRVTEKPLEPIYDFHHRPIFRDGTVMYAHDCAVELYDAATTELLFSVERPSLCYAQSYAFSERFLVVGIDEKIRLVDRRTGMDYAVTTYDRASVDAVLDDRYLAFRDERSDHFDLYVIDLSDFDDGDFFPEGLPP